MKVTQILETCLYSQDLERSKAFYTEILGLDFFAEAPGRHVFFRCGEAMLLLFDPVATETSHPGLEVPPHGAKGPGHCCFTLAEAEIDSWRKHLDGHGVAVEREIDWPGGGLSLYFRDPDANSLELATRRVWGFSD